MAVAFVASNRSGASDVLGTSNTCPVAAGGAAGNVALLAVKAFIDTDPAITFTWPADFTQIANVSFLNGDQIGVAKKTLTGADAGNYVTTLSATRWHQSMVMLFSGTSLVVGTPDTETGTGTSITSMSVDATLPGLAMFQSNASAASHTPATGFTETQEGDYITAAYRIPGTSGTHTASGATISTSTDWSAVLVAIEEGGAAGTSMPFPRRLDRGLILRPKRRRRA